MKVRNKIGIIIKYIEGGVRVYQRGERDKSCSDQEVSGSCQDDWWDFSTSDPSWGNYYTFWILYIQFLYAASFILDVWKRLDTILGNIKFKMFNNGMMEIIIEDSRLFSLILNYRRPVGIFF